MDFNLFSKKIKKNLRNSLLFLISILIVFGFPISSLGMSVALDMNTLEASGSAIEVLNTHFKSVDDWAKEEVEKSQVAGLIPGTFIQSDLKKAANRQEFCQILVCLIEKIEGKGMDVILYERNVDLDMLKRSSPFQDTNDTNILAMNALGITQGYEGFFRPENIVLRSDAAVMLKKTANFLGYVVPNGKPLNFTDAYAIPSWAKDSVKFLSGQRDMTGKSVMSGYKNEFHANQTYSLQESIVSVWRLYSSFQHQGNYEEWENVKGWNTVQVTVSAAGDCTFGRNEGSPYESSFDETYDKQKNASYFFQNVKEFQNDDISIVNFEGTLTELKTPVEKEFRFKGRPIYAEILQKGSVEIVNIANNHTRDYGEKGYKDTINNLSKYVQITGYDKMPIIEVNGVKVGFFGTKSWQYDEASKKFVKSAVANLKENGAQIIIGSFHWGVEKEYKSNIDQQKLGRFCVDNGVDLVIGHHPHVLEEVETYKGKQIVYSLGNFSYGGHRNPVDKNTMVFQQSFVVDLDDGKIVSESHQKIPYKISSVKNRNNYQPTPVKVAGN